MHTFADDQSRSGRLAPLVARVAHAVDGRRLGTVALTTLLVSLGALVNPSLIEFFSPVEIAVAWLEHLVELGTIALALLLAFSLFERALPRRLPFRLAALLMLLFGASVVLTLGLYGYYAGGFEHRPPPMRLLADSLKWGLPAVFVALIADVHGRAMQTDVMSVKVELSHEQLRRGAKEQQLALLQAQIEPHFLFNVLISVRRLYRTRAASGADAISSLLTYLRSALPRMRLGSGTLADELDLVRAYLELFRIRFGSRLTFSVEAENALLGLAFPPMLLVTLAENAVKHGLDPQDGGSVSVTVRRSGGMLVASVLDKGVGFGAVAVSGTGSGLVNVRRQLAAQYPGEGRLELTSCDPHGACATIVIPARWASPDVVQNNRAPIAEVLPGPTIDELPAGPPADLASFARWFGRHRGAVTMAGLLAFAAPVTFFTGALSVMREPRAADWAALSFWWLLYGVELCGLLLVGGWACLLMGQAVASKPLRVAAWTAAAIVASGCVAVTTEGRGTFLAEQGVVQDTRTMMLYSFVLSLTMSAVYFAYLRRSRRHEVSVMRLAAAQRAQHEMRQRIARVRITQAQARVDPVLLFGMLEAVRASHARDPELPERLIDELIDFLRAASPAPGRSSSSVPREAELARSYARLRGLADRPTSSMVVDLSRDMVHARFPPGVLLPLLENALSARAGPSTLRAVRIDSDCCLELTLPVPPSDEVLARVAALLLEVCGEGRAITLDGCVATIKVPYELA